MTRTLLANHISYEFGDLNTISSGWGKVEKGSFVVGKMAYGTVVLPRLSVLDKKTAELIAEFSKQGGKVFVLGAYPEMLDGKAFDVKGTYLEKATFVPDIVALTEALSATREYDIACDLSDTAVRVYRTKTDKEQFIMLFNSDCKSPRNCRFTVCGNFAVAQADADSVYKNLSLALEDADQCEVFLNGEQAAP